MTVLYNHINKSASFIYLYITNTYLLNNTCYYYLKFVKFFDIKRANSKSSSGFSNYLSIV